MSGAPAWLDRFEADIGRRQASHNSSAPLLLRISGKGWHRAAEFPQSDSRPVDKRRLRIASITKVYVAAALHRLVEDGRLNLHAPTAEVVGEDTKARLSAARYDVAGMTVDQLMRHTSGLHDHCFSDLFLDQVKAKPRFVWSRADQIGIATRLGAPLSKPGERFAYSDTGYVILGEVVERAAGASLADALPKLLRFDELGLAETRWDDLDSDAADLVPQYLGAVEATRWHPSFDLFGGGGLVSTLAEIDRFLRALLGGRIFAHENTLRRIAADMSTPSDPGFVHNGLMFKGRIANEEVWAHTGFWGLQAAILPARDLVLTAAFNRAPEPGVYGKDELLVDFAQAVAKAQ